MKTCVLVCLFALLAAGPASAQSSTAAATAPAIPAGGRTAALVDPVMIRDADGKITIRATRITTPLRIDGRLDDAAYREVPTITEFVQQEPKNGEPVTEKTESWVFFDDDNLYVACRCWDTHPERIVANDMRRDGNNLPYHDHFAVALDTFHDGRNAYRLYMTALGAMHDTAISDLRTNVDWNPIWDGKTSRFENGWISEMAFPFKSLRYGTGRQQTWGIQLRRSIAHKNEDAFVTPTSPQWGQAAMRHVGAYATLIGLEVPPSARNLEIKPYAISRVTTDLLRNPAIRNDVEPAAGLDVKYGLTKGLTADFTYNTDFAQVEADEAQVNLTRFSLSFPEKREFFIEGYGLFEFGTNGPGITGAGPGGGGGDVPTLLYTRRIGLSGSRVIPVIAGGRLSGRAGPWGLGALSITTDDDEVSRTPQTNFSVLRLRRDVLRRGTVGAIYSRRSVSTVAPGDNQLWGLDTSLGLEHNMFVDAYVSQTQTEGRPGDDRSYRGQFSYVADRYGVAFDHLVVEDNFNPEIGFLRREDFRRSVGQLRFSPRTTDHPVIRRVDAQGRLEYTSDNHDRLETRELGGDFAVDFHNSDQVSVGLLRTYELVPTPFQIARGVTIPVGGYSFHNTSIRYNAGQQHRTSGSSSFQVGDFYGGTKKTLGLRARAEVTPQLSVEPNISLNWVDLPQGKFTDTVVGGRATYSITTRSFVAALVQYSSSNTSLSTNLRLRWEYQPGSEMFIVYTEGRSTLPTHGVPLENRGFVVKVNRLFRF